MSIVRKCLAVVGGMITGAALIAATEAIGHGRFRGDLVFVAAIVGYGLGATAGTWVAGRLAGSGAAAVVPVILGALAAVNLVTFPHPLWFAPAAVASLVAGWLAGSRLSFPKREEP